MRVESDYIFVANMKLITHNMLTSNIIKGVKKGFPLGITVSHCVMRSTVVIIPIIAQQLWQPPCS